MAARKNLPDRIHVPAVKLIEFDATRWDGPPVAIREDGRLLRTVIASKGLTVPDASSDLMGSAQRLAADELVRLKWRKRGGVRVTATPLGRAVGSHIATLMRRRTAR